ncbi:hypothetical protein M5K25_010517 [Dendrobium thyrsiflorum]|uniref:Isopenicillin N synthase-like Fe(2+) 2OG dioxygenase domain-containing protein n=1 Tax=Dendrobium thyrsiflorum TaxID=117978 RepID=A0ABD0V7S4_DENTH
MNSLSHSIRFSNYYKNALDDGINLALPSHKDPNYISIMWKHSRLHAPNHRVKLKNETEKRYTVIFSTIPSLTNDMINAPEELIDEQHPLLFMPFKSYDYVKFCFSKEGEKTNDALKAYCGV